MSIYEKVRCLGGKLRIRAERCGVGNGQLRASFFNSDLLLVELKLRPRHPRRWGNKVGAGMRQTGGGLGRTKGWGGKRNALRTFATWHSSGIVLSPPLPQIGERFWGREKKEEDPFNKGTCGVPHGPHMVCHMVLLWLLLPRPRSWGVR